MWQFWIDVGGTFTDCVACRPDGSIVTHKLLSSGVTKGSVGDGSTAGAIRDTARSSAPPQFFRGFLLTLLGHATVDGRIDVVPLDADVPVVDFDAAEGKLELGRPLRVAPRPGTLYELRSGEEAPVTGIRWLMGKRLDEGIGPVEVRLGTTRGTNALLERQGAPTTPGPPRPARGGPPLTAPS